MRHTLQLTLAALTLALGGTALASAASAQEVEPLVVYGHRVAPGSQIVSVVVPYGDLNLTTYPAADVMLGRIRGAAKTICGTESANPIDRATIWRPCVEDITYRAVADFGNPLVSQLNDERMGGGMYRASYPEDDYGPGY
jgi:UrcA family protein